jgi:glutathione synthase/RimK-type ligase-like ATP-grasp enzyme
VQNASAQRHRIAPQGAALHCGVLAESRYLAQAQPRGLMEALVADGHSVRLIDSGAGALDVDDSRWMEGLDVLVARGRSPELLARLGLAEAMGIPTPNRRRAIAAVLDKAHMATVLRAAGIPTPPTWIGGIEQLRRDIPRAAYPLVVKPVFGDNGRGVHIVDTPQALEQLDWSEPTAIAQRYIANDGFDVKLYAIGMRVWGMRKPSPLHRFSAEPEPVTLTPEWRDLALRCGEVFGLRLFGVDCIESDGQLHVIEVNDFPNYSGVPDAGALLAAHVLQHGHTRRTS